MDKGLKIIPISNVFTLIRYIIPIYQRNYAWSVMEIEQLIEDVDSSIHDVNQNYFLGNLIVNQTDHHAYEVIDGQQRLTTLFLLSNYLGMNVAKDALRFEAREKSNRTLHRLIQDNQDEVMDDLISAEIVKGYQVIETYFKSNNINPNEFVKKLDKVFLVRIQVPQGIDLNHYFEIMNTRGEQLELHEIAKAKFLEVLDTEHDKKTAALIWDKCANMDSYIQMNFDPNIRKSLFTDDWSSMNEHITDFDAIGPCIPKVDEDKSAIPLIEILKNKKRINYGVSKDEVENERFESIISFPDFLLQVNAVINKLKEDDSTLDDKHFLHNLSWAWENAASAKHFLYHLLKCPRVV